MRQPTQTASTEMSWTTVIGDQFQWHWDHQIRARLEGLSDEEYFWEPVTPSWNVRRRADVAARDEAQIMAGSGDFSIDFATEEPTPPPVTTIAWRLGHVIVGILGERNCAHFDGPPITYQSFEYAGTAHAALDQLDDGVARWLDGVRSLCLDELSRPCGGAEGSFAEAPMAELVLHINRELIHHLAEIALLRDLYVHRG